MTKAAAGIVRFDGEPMKRDEPVAHTPARKFTAAHGHRGLPLALTSAKATEMVRGCGEGARPPAGINFISSCSSHRRRVSSMMCPACINAILTRQ